MSASTIHGTQRSDGDAARLLLAAGASPAGARVGDAAAGRGPPGGDGGRPFGVGPSAPGSAAGVEIGWTTAHRSGRTPARRPPGRRPSVATMLRPEAAATTHAQGPRSAAGIVRSVHCAAPGDPVERRPIGTGPASRAAGGRAAGHAGASATSIAALVRRPPRLGRRRVVRRRRATSPTELVVLLVGAGRRGHRLAGVRRPAQGPRVAAGRLRLPVVRGASLDRRRAVVLRRDRAAAGRR